MSAKKLKLTGRCPKCRGKVNVWPANEPGRHVVVCANPHAKPPCRYRADFTAHQFSIGESYHWSCAR